MKSNGWIGPPRLTDSFPFHADGGYKHKLSGSIMNSTKPHYWVFGDKPQAYPFRRMPSERLMRRSFS
ncbi:hypothetical protein CEXT_517831 [Caerostris extrusa]|uniref:Ycf15 n=1 Tax=Caerostris extrusa TaxID=172846 RepID=A0AAV4SJ50_CAEEX|nr:hypothetical protein CEXT_517831 [Caerostris extrusa]